MMSIFGQLKAKFACRSHTSLMHNRKLPSRIRQRYLPFIISRCASLRAQTSPKALSKKPGNRAKVPTQYMPQSGAFQETLASRSSTTILYLAPVSNNYMLTAYGIGSFCLAYGIFNIYDMATQKRDGLWWAVPVIMNVVSGFMLCVGCVAFVRARHLVKSIRAIPVKGIAGQKVLSVQLEARRLLPFLGPGQIIECRPQDIILRRRVRDIVDESVSWHRDHVKRPGGPAAGIPGPFYPVRALVSGEGFTTLDVKGSTWRMDVGAGKIIDNGQSLDRLFRCVE